MSNPPASFKSVLSVLKRADELDKSSNRDENVVGYYCRYYAVTKCIKLSKSASADEKTFLADQMTKLEQMKPSLGVSNTEGERICREYANGIFKAADDIDRSGLADKGVAKLFYSAGTIYDILEQFGALDNEILEKKKYAKWKAADILNAINSGQRPLPGGFGETAVPEEGQPAASDPSASIIKPMTQLSPPSSAISPLADIPSVPAHPPAAPQPSTPQPMVFPSAPIYQPAPAVTAPAPTTKPSASGPTPGFQPPRGPPINNADPRVKDAVELCNFAVAALKHNEIALAKDRLQEALRRLG